MLSFGTRKPSPRKPGVSETFFTVAQWVDQQFLTLKRLGTSYVWRLAGKPQNVSTTYSKIETCRINTPWNLAVRRIPASDNVLQPEERCVGSAVQVSWPFLHIYELRNFSTAG
ncbi:uncharacterized protein BDCG_01128 [Blastomyces dermatitidis ER-3]|uniref:Uncharacterized protein n=2 Tax=Ajellomyces dermatitidis TaxID=5039 RepID=F2TSG8_AJEDA|nr:uncharacterized protein BDCG_01128 [Blastomyces dermatitidis ER-3]EEQ84323.2 hypothetical protein BDCG_01128 [Blastomyces dermatitidis ER-3]EGE86181.2 hypothetical protein BDDG_09126 [Blastomyces dermatitidis ATCC 18188]